MVIALMEGEATSSEKHRTVHCMHLGRAFPPEHMGLHGFAPREARTRHCAYGEQVLVAVAL